MNTTDKERIDSLCEAVNLARSYGFSSLSSPVDLLIEAAVDLMLLLEKSFKEGSSGRRLNPSLKETETVDPLGNLKIIKLRKQSKLFFDPRVADIIKQFAAFFVLLKKSSNEALSFMEMVLRSRFFPPKEITSEQTKKVQKVEKRLKSESKSAYYRRIRKNRTKIH